MMMHMPMFVLDQLFENQDPNASGCLPTSCRPSARAAARSCSGPRASAQAPKARARSPIQEPRAAKTINHASFRELSDTYLLWADLPGLARDDLKVTVTDGFINITGQQKARDIPSDASQELQAALRAMPRKAVDVKIPLPKDANLNGIRAKLIDGELTITMSKQAPQHFSIPVLAGNELPNPSAEPAALDSAPPAAVTEAKTAKDAAKPVQAVATEAAAAEPTIADLPYPDHLAALRDSEQKAEENSVKSDSAAATSAPAPAPAATATSEEAESDGSWEDVSDEEREAERRSRRSKGALPATGPVLEEIAQQEAAQQAAALQDAAASSSG